MSKLSILDTYKELLYYIIFLFICYHVTGHCILTFLNIPENVLDIPDMLGGIVSLHSAFVLTFLNVPENVPDIPDMLSGSSCWTYNIANVLRFSGSYLTTLPFSETQSTYGICYAQALLEQSIDFGSAHHSITDNLFVMS